MHIESLRIFCDVARHRSFSRGAEEHGITQSTASQAVHVLETRLGVTLIDRSHRPWRLTPQGEAFHEGCRDLIRQYDELEARVKGVPAAAGREVRVVSIYSVGLRHMQHYVEQFARTHPRAQVRWEYVHPDRVYDAVLKDEADLGIVSFPRPGRDLSVIPWKFEPMALACSPRHPLARRREIDPAKLAGEKFVAFDRGLVIRREIDRFLRRLGVHVDVVLEFDNIESIKQAVEEGSGVSLLPLPTLERQVRAGVLAAVPLTEEFTRPLGIIHRRGKGFDANVADFVRLLQQDKEAGAREAVAATR